MSVPFFTRVSNKPMHFRAYEAAPGISVIVLPDAPVYTHVSVSNDLIRATGLSRQKVIGRSILSFLPKAPMMPTLPGN